MKNLLSISVMVLFFVFLQSCVEEQATPSSSSVSTRFSFPLQNGSESEIRNSSVNVSITDENGIPVLTDYSVPFVVRDGYAETESIILAPGEYRLTALSVGNDRDKFANIIYGSQKGQASPDGLSFSIAAKSIVVIDINALKGIKANQKFQLAVYTDDGGKKTPTTGTAYLMDGATVLRTYQLDAKLNKLAFDLDPSATYTLAIVKNGYARIAEDFVYDQIGNKPLKYDLTPGMTMLAIPSAGLNNLFSFTVAASSGTLDVDWGDGTTESHSFTAADNFVDFTREYATSNPYYVTVTGDLEQITYFYSFYGNGEMHEADFYSLTGLIELRFGLMEGPSIIDLSNNSNLQQLLMPGLLHLEQLLLPADHNISDINISGSDMMTPAEVDAVIANIYNNSIANSINNGEFNVSTDWGSSEAGLFIGPPSATGFSQLAYLRDNLGWLIAPEF